MNISYVFLAFAIGGAIDCGRLFFEKKYKSALIPLVATIVGVGAAFLTSQNLSDGAIAGASISGLIATLKKFGSSFAEGAKSSIKTAENLAIKSATSTPSGTSEAGSLEKIVSDVKTVPEKIVSGVKTAVQSGEDEINKIISDLKNGDIESALSDTQEGISGSSEQVNQTIEDAKTLVNDFNQAVKEAQEIIAADPEKYIENVIKEEK